MAASCWVPKHMSHANKHAGTLNSRIHGRMVSPVSLQLTQFLLQSLARNRLKMMKDVDLGHIYVYKALHFPYLKVLMMQTPRRCNLVLCVCAMTMVNAVVDSFTGFDGVTTPSKFRMDPNKVSTCCGATSDSWKFALVRRYFTPFLTFFDTSFLNGEQQDQIGILSRSSWFMGGNLPKPKEIRLVN